MFQHNHNNALNSGNRLTMKIITLCFNFIFLGMPLYAQSFEGTIEMRVTAIQGKGAVKLHISKLGQRTDIDVGGSKQSVILKASQADSAFILNDAAKTVLALDLKAAMKQNAQINTDTKYTVEKLGKATIAGYACEHVKLSSDETSIELWTTKSVMSFESYQKLQRQNPNLSSSSFIKALKDAKADGFPVKMIQQGEDIKFESEVVKVEKKKIPTSLFEIPKDFARTSLPQN
jgi:hypothetical protein